MSTSAEERWDRLFLVLPFPLLAFAVAVAFATGPATGSLEPTGRLVAQVGLVVVLVGWIWWWTLAHPQWRQDRSRMQVYYAGRTALALVLTLLNPLYCIFAWIGFIDAHDYFRRRACTVSMAATSITMAIGQSGGLPPAHWWQLVALFMLNFALASLFGGYGRILWESNEERAVVIVELEQVNADLERALAENAALQDTVLTQAREAGVQEERQRLAREIHDTLAQSLAGILAQVQAAAADPAAAGVRDRLGLTAALARGALADARRSVMDLAPAPLTCHSLAVAVTDLAQGWSTEHRVHADVVVTGEPRPLHLEVEATVLRVAQEALSNVAKHARAERVGVTLSFDENEVILDVRDDGVGFDTDHPRQPASFGLRGMRQRTERLAGSLAIEAEAGAGTALSVRLPAVRRGAA